MKYLLMFFLLMSCNSIAKDIFIPSKMFTEAELPAMAPFVFIFNQQGQLIYRETGTDPTFARAIKQNKPTADAEEIKSKLAKAITLPDLTEASFTVIYTLMDGNCPPCDRKEAMLDEILPKLAPATFKRYTITLTHGN